MTAREQVRFAAQYYRERDGKPPKNDLLRVLAYEAWLAAVRRFWLAQRCGTLDL